MSAKVLKLSKYRPNFNDPRVKRRIAEVLAWARPILIETRPRPVSSHELTKIFGNQDHALSEYLRANLLIRSGMYRVKSKFFDYSIKREGFTKLSLAVGAAARSNVEVARDLYSPIANGQLHIEYSEPTPGKRRYHPVQNLPRPLRSAVFEGWYDYDIESAAPSLVLQFARRGQSLDSPDPYINLQLMISEKARLRAHVGELTGLGHSDVKRIINGIFFGAKLQASSKTKVFQTIQENRTILDRLKDDREVAALVTQAKEMWKQVVRLDGGLRTGSVTTLAAKRMAIYQSLEREVIEAMESVMVAADIQYVLMHDGFMANRVVDRHACQAAALAQTGFNVSLTEDQLTEKKVWPEDQDEPDVAETIDG